MSTYAEQLLQKSGVTTKKNTVTSSGGSASSQLLNSVKTNTYNPTPYVAPQVQNVTTPTVQNKGIDWGRIKTAFVSGAKAIPGSVKVATGIILDSWSKQMEALNSGIQITKNINTKKFVENMLPPVGVMNTFFDKQTKQVISKAKDVAPKIRESGQESVKKNAEAYNSLPKSDSTVQKYAEMIAFNAPQMIATTGLTFATAILTKNPALASAVGVSTSYGMGASEVYNDARQGGLSDKEAYPLSALGGIVIGALDFVPLERLLRKSGAFEPVKQTLIKKITQGIVSLGIQSGFEGATEGIQEIVGNAIKSTYTENQDLLEGVKESLIVGALMGAGANVTVESITGAISKGKTPEEITKEINKKIEEALGTPAEKRTSEQSQIVQALTERELTPDQAITLIAGSEYQNSKEGKEIVLKALEAKAKDSNILLKVNPKTQEMEIEVIDKQAVKSKSEDLVSTIQKPEDANFLPTAPNLPPVENKPAIVQEVKNYSEGQVVVYKGDAAKFLTNKGTNGDLADIEFYDGTIKRVSKSELSSLQDSKNKDTQNKPEYAMSHRPSKTGAIGSDITKNGEVIPTDFYDHPEYYANMSDPIYKESFKAIEKMRGNPDADVTVYRASVKNELNNGDWITLSKKYAEGEARDDTKVYSHIVKAKDIQFAGDDINEFGYYPKEDSKDADNSKRLADIPSEISKLEAELKNILDENRPKVEEAVDQIMAEMEIATAGERIFIEDPNSSEPIIKGIPSTFPQWISEDLRSRKLFDGLMADVLKMIDNPQYPTGNRPRLRALYDEIMSEVDSRAGIDTSSIRGDIISLYDEASQIKKDSKLVSSGPEGSKEKTSKEKVNSDKKQKTKSATNFADVKPVGTEKIKESRLYKRVKEQLGADFDSKEVNYNQLSLEKQSLAVAELIQNDPEKAVRIVRGVEETPNGMTVNAIEVGLASLAESKGDFATAGNFWTRISLRSTRLGQEIVSLRGSMGLESPLNAVRSVINSRIELLAEKYKNVIEGLEVSYDATPAQKVDAYVKSETKKLNKQLTDQQKRIQNAQSIIDNLIC